jgi:3-hydroxypropanoate dehydrogenase
MTDEKCLDVILRTARTHNVFTDRPVSDATLRQAHELMKWGPTSANSQPGRFVFVRSRQAKEKLRPALSETNREKTMQAPLTAIVAYDTRFYEHLPRMFHNPAAIDWFRGEDKKALAEITAFRNGTLQGAYFIIAARAVGLDCGPMSRWPVEVELPHQPGLRRPGEALSAQSPARLRGAVPDRLAGRKRGYRSRRWSS